jgi:hypothetical protein
MRGVTCKRLRKFAEYLINNTPENQINKSKNQMVDELKIHWKTQGKVGQKFIRDTLAGKFEPK